MSRQIQNEAMPQYLVEKAPLDYTERELQNISNALDSIYLRLKAKDSVTSPGAASKRLQDYFTLLLGPKQEEHFVAMWLNTSHGVISTQILFSGTIDSASVYPRVVVKQAIAHNAAAVILAHNHPSGTPEPSQADIMLTGRLKDALATIDVRVLDHLVVGATVISFAERGLI